MDVFEEAEGCRRKRSVSKHAVLEKWLKKQRESGEEGREKREEEEWMFRSSKKLQRSPQRKEKEIRQKKEEKKREGEKEIEFNLDV